MRLSNIFKPRDLYKFRKYNLIDAELLRAHYASKDEAIIDIRLLFAYNTAERLASRNTDLFNHIYDYIMTMPFSEILAVISSEEVYKEWQRQLMQL